MKKFFTGVLALTICGVINFGLTGEAQAADLSATIGLNDVELQELYGPPPPHHRPPLGHRPPPMHRPWHRPGPPPPPPEPYRNQRPEFHRHRQPPPPPPPPEPYRNQRPRW